MQYWLISLLSILSFSSVFAQQDTVKWHLYNNQSYHFSISYPDFCYETDTSDPVSPELKKLYREHNTLSYYEEKMVYSISFGNQAVPIFTVSIFDNKENLRLKSFADKVIDGSGLYKKTEISYQDIRLDHHKALMAIFQNKAGGYDGTNKYVFIKKDDLVYSILIINLPEGDYDVFLKNILNSFKFSD